MWGLGRSCGVTSPDGSSWLVRLLSRKGLGSGGGKYDFVGVAIFRYTEVGLVKLC